MFFISNIVEEYSDMGKLRQPHTNSSNSKENGGQVGSVLRP